MTQPFLIFAFFCLGPLLLIAFGYWLGKGTPGWPWALVRRDGQAQSGYRANYYDREEFQP